MRALIAALALAPAFAYSATTGKAQRTAEQFREADIDGNGALSLAEAGKALPWLAKHFAAIDVNRDGQVSPEEIRAYRRAARKTSAPGHNARTGLPGTKFEEYFSRADTDGDGALSRAEAGQGMPRVAGKFERIDRDGDGRLSLDELKDWLALRRSARAG